MKEQLERDLESLQRAYVAMRTRAETAESERDTAESERDTAQAGMQRVCIDLEAASAEAFTKGVALKALQAKVARAVSLLQRSALTQNDAASKRLATEALEALR